MISRSNLIVVLLPLSCPVGVVMVPRSLELVERGVSVRSWAVPCHLMRIHVTLWILQLTSRTVHPLTQAKDSGSAFVFLCRYPHIGWPAQFLVEPLPEPHPGLPVWPLLTCHLLKRPCDSARVTFSLSLVFFLHVFIKLCVYLNLVCLLVVSLMAATRTASSGVGVGNNAGNALGVQYVFFEWMSESSWSPRLIYLCNPIY